MRTSLIKIACAILLLTLVSCGDDSIPIEEPVQPASVSDPNSKKTEPASPDQKPAPDKDTAAIRTK